MVEAINLNARDGRTSKNYRPNIMIMIVNDIKCIHKKLNELANDIVHRGNSANNYKINVKKNNTESLSDLLKNSPEIISKKSTNHVLFVDLDNVYYRMSII